MSGMSAMERMVANMIGITPEKMSEMLTGFSTLATTLKAQMDGVERDLKAVLENQAEIMAAIGRIENVGRNGDNNRRRGNAGRGTGAGNGGQSDGTSADAGSGDGKPAA